MNLYTFLKKLLLLCLFASTILLANAQTSKKQGAPLKLSSVEGITEYKLANGLRVLLLSDSSVATITVNITYLVGSKMEGYGEAGMAHLLEHMAFKGSTKHLNIPQELTVHGARANANTAYDWTRYFETFTASAANLNWALGLESDRMVNSFIAVKDLQSEFSVVRNEFESGENNPSNVLEERVESTAYLWHNYGKTVIGSKEDIERVPIANLQAFYKKYYQPDNAVLMVSGKIDEAKTLQLINQYFGSIPRPQRIIDPSYTVEPMQDGERSVTLRRVGDVQVVACGYHIPSGTHPDFAALDILQFVMANKPSGRLYKSMVETQKASTIEAWTLANASKDPGYIYFMAAVPKEKSLELAKIQMQEVLDSVAVNPITVDELDRARNSLLKNFEELYNNSMNLNIALTEYIGAGDWRLLFIYRDNLKKVSVAEVNKVAATYFKSSNRTVGLFIPEKNPVRAIIPPSPDVMALVKDYKGEPVLARAEVFDPSPANIDKRTETGTIPGGAKYALLTKTTQGNKVNAKLTLRFGNETNLQNKAVLAKITTAMLRRGTEGKTFQQINDELDKLKTSISFANDGQEATITITSTKENFVKALRILNEMLRHPSFSQKELDIIIEENLSAVEQQKSDPRDIASNTLRRSLAPYSKGHIKYTMTFDEQIAATKSVTLPQVKQFYTDFFNSTFATVAVVGDCDESATLQSLTSLLQNRSSVQPYARVEDKYFDVAATDQKIITPDKKNAWFFASQNIEMQDDDPNYAPLLLGNFILGGGFLNSRLATRIRQKDGLSYGVGSWLDANPVYKSGSFGSYAIYNPDNLDKLDKAYKEEIAKILKEGITEDELKAAKSALFQERQVNRSQDDFLVTKLNSNLSLDRSLAWDAGQEKQIASLTVDQVNAALRKYIQPEKISYVKAGDFK